MRKDAMGERNVERRAYPNSNRLSGGVTVLIFAPSLSQGDAVSIEYPDKTRASATVTECGTGTLILNVIGDKWQLSRVETDSSAPAGDEGERPTTWEIQGRIST
jgi:hypothetical protein